MSDDDSNAAAELAERPRSTRAERSKLLRANKHERQLKAISLRRGGASYRQIAEQVGVSVFTAYADCKAMIAETMKKCHELATEVRQLDLDRLDTMLAGVWGDIILAPQRVRQKDGSTTAVRFEDANPQAQRYRKRVQARSILLGLRIMERRAKLLGLDQQGELDLGNVGEFETAWGPPLQVTQTNVSVNVDGNGHATNGHNGASVLDVTPPDDDD